MRCGVSSAKEYAMQSRPKPIVTRAGCAQQLLLCSDVLAVAGAQLELPSRLQAAAGSSSPLQGAVNAARMRNAAAKRLPVQRPS